MDAFDLVIVKERSLAYINFNTAAGREWMYTNMKMDGFVEGWGLSIIPEAVEELEEMIGSAGLSVDVR